MWCVHPKALLFAGSRMPTRRISICGYSTRRHASTSWNGSERTDSEACLWSRVRKNAQHLLSFSAAKVSE